MAQSRGDWYIVQGKINYQINTIKDGRQDDKQNAKERQ